MLTRQIDPNLASPWRFGFDIGHEANLPKNAPNYQLIKENVPDNRWVVDPCQA
jgi:hypothetical protein